MYNSWYTWSLQYEQLKHSVPKERLKSALQAVDTKFTLIPVIFLWLRIWTVVLTVIYDYAQIPDKSIPQGVAETLIYLSVSQWTLLPAGIMVPCTNTRV